MSDALKNGRSAVAEATPFLYAPASPGGERTNVAPGAAAAPAPSQPAEPAAAPTLTPAPVRAEFEKALVELRAQISGALRQFTTEREGYFEKVEPEVVQLALSIARKILHRESQIDPLLLAGVVHVALERINEGTRTRLRTNPSEIRYWRDYFAQADDIVPKPELIGDPSLKPGFCTLETELGTTNISLETQLKEIEQGFLDLLEQRPRVQE